MVYGFAKQSGGHAQIESEPGLGTTVRLYLPAAEKAPAREPEEGGGRTEAPGETILVVEDDPRVRRVSVRRLKGLGYAVLEAEDGPAALRLINDGSKVDLLFTDIMMPGGVNGIELARKAMERRAGLKVLFTSGFAEPTVLHEALQATGARWLGKPYRTDELSTRLRDLLARPEKDTSLIPASPKRQTRSRRPVRS
jgi:CheY-like chemotaxis protein